MRTSVLEFNPKGQIGKDKGKFKFAEEVQQIAARLITEHHGHLAEAKIAYLFREGDWKKGGRDVFGKAYKAPEQWQFLAEYDLLVVINQNVWHRLAPEQKKALVDHELCHFFKDVDSKGNLKWVLLDHDVEEFAAVIRRHGLWSEEIRSFMNCAKQMTLDDVSRTAEEVKATIDVVGGTVHQE